MKLDSIVVVEKDGLLSFLEPAVADEDEEAEENRENVKNALGDEHVIEADESKDEGNEVIEEEWESEQMQAVHQG